MMVTILYTLLILNKLVTNDSKRTKRKRIKKLPDMFKLYYRNILVLLFVSMATVVFSQNVGINTTAANPSQNAILDLNSGNTSKNLGVVIPNVSITAMTTFNAPMAHAFTTQDSGIMVYNTNTSVGSGAGYYYWSATTMTTGTWVAFASSGSLSSTCGTASANYIPDFFSSTCIINSVIYQSGSTLIGVGTTSPANTLDIYGAMAVGSYAGVSTAPANGMIVSGRVGIGTSSPSSSAALDLSNTSNLGLLTPRMTALQINAIASPANGLIVYNTNSNCYQFYTTSPAGWNDIACPCSSAPSALGAIIGPASICTGNSYTYSVAPVTGATGYTWTVPANVGNITSGQGTDEITISATSNVYGIGNYNGTLYGVYYNPISVTATNLCGSTTSATTEIQLNPAHDTLVFICYTAAQVWVVPACISQVTVELWGAGGGSSYNSTTTTWNSVGGAGGFVEGVMGVTPGQVDTIVVGAGGEANVSGLTSGPYGGGGLPGQGLADGSAADEYAASGGGRSAIIFGASTKDFVTAGGGGGAGLGYNNIGTATADEAADSASGGAGGAEIGGTAGTSYTEVAATGGNTTTSTGGSAGTYSVTPTYSGTAGSYRQGGKGGTNSYYGGGGGGGYYGGGGGSGKVGGGGAGGSNFTTNLTTIMGDLQGNSYYEDHLNATQLPPNTADPNYITGIGVGAFYNATTPAGTAFGGDGLVIIMW
jgi:hypothetical protein